MNDTNVEPMRRTVVFLLLALLAAAPLGCPKSSSVSVEYEVRGVGGFSKGTWVSDTGRATMDKNTLELKAGHIFANDKDCGPVKDGDKVLLDHDSKLFVNGVKREPQ